MPIQPVPTISPQQAIAIAEEDALPVYGAALHKMVLRAALYDDGWHINYDLKEPNLQGGGPHYVIDATTGAIVTKHYYQ
ncbi:MAG: PepSY domain-containing protein [Planctomycetia bacterium]|nr:PepSY domain-containing protein [Planctomycetia bacterium]